MAAAVTAGTSGAAIQPDPQTVLGARLQPDPMSGMPATAVGISPEMRVNRFALTEYGVVMVCRRRVVQLDVVGRFALVLRGALLLARLLRLLRLLPVRGLRGGYRSCAERCRDGYGTKQRCDVLRSYSHHH